jgi:replicative DNA helicase
MDDTLQLTTDIIAGKHRSELILIPKTTTEERTATIITVANIALKHEIPMAIFSLELSNARILAHVLADSAEPDVIKALEAKHANGQVQQRLDAIKGKPVYLDDSPTLSIGELKAKASKLVNEHGVRVILIDYLELMEEYETVDLNAILNAIIAKELGVQLIVLSSKLNIKR